MRKNLTKDRILRKKTDIDTVFAHGKRFSKACFKLVVVKNLLEVSRFIVIPVKHFGNSVERNKIRRQIKEIWREHSQDVRPGFDVAIIVYKLGRKTGKANKNATSGTSLTFAEKENTLLNLLEVGGLLEA